MVRSRLIHDAAASGSWNMSVDGALLETAAAGGDPCLRFYGWQPAALSLGYFQPFFQRAEHTDSSTLPVVRRSTGGGAIVHQHELTYSLAVPGKSRFAPGGVSIVAAVHEALVRALAQWQVDATLQDEYDRHRTAPEPFLCFQRRTAGDVLLSGDKICGSALRQRHKATLVHGSVLLAASAYAAELPGLNDLTVRPVAVEELAAVWIDEIATRLRFTFERDGLTEPELQHAQRLQSQRYSAAEWTQKR